MVAKLEIDWSKIEEIIARYESDKESLLMIMQDISDLYHFVPPEVVPVLAEKLGVRKSLIFSVATFYKTISLVPRGKYIVHVCTGTACHVRGAEKVMDAIKGSLAHPRRRDHDRWAVHPGRGSLHRVLRVGPGHDGQQGNPRRPGPISDAQNHR